MPYDKHVPSQAQNPTVFPLPVAKDFLFALKVNQEKWKRFFPEIVFRKLLRYSTEAKGTVDELLRTVGDGTGGTVSDAQYGEAIRNLDEVGDWYQPHSATDSPPDADSAETERFADPLILQGRIQVEWKDYELQKYGIEERIDLIVTFVSKDLDESNVLVDPGDELSWQGRDFKVHQAKPAGFWKNTDLYLFVQCFCTRKHEGA